MDKIENFLILSGWERPTWDGGVFGPGTVGAPDPSSTDARHFVRADRTTQDRWRYTGDLLTQHGGIVVWHNPDPTAAPYGPNLGGSSNANESGEQIVLQSFLENSGATAVQVYTPDHVGLFSTFNRFGSVRLVVDNLAVNNYLLYGGEDGLYIEVGRDSSPNNIGHGAIMTFGEIPELHGTRGFATKWTAQGLVCDFRGRCRFSQSRNDRFVSNDGSNKNFTASLQPYSPRGTADVDSLATLIANQRPYYIGARDNFLSMGYGSPSTTTSDFGTSSSGISSKYAATLGLIDTPKDDRIRISPLVMIQEVAHVNAGVTSALSSNNVAAAGSALSLIDIRDKMRQIFRFAAADHTLIPSLSVVDAVSGATYRIARFDDDGRFSQFGVEVPTATLTLP
jgi:hypothetical protein